MPDNCTLPLARSRSRRLVSAGTLALSSLLVALPLNAQQPKTQEQDGAKILLPILMAAVAPALQTGIGCLFERMISFMGANRSAACVQPNTTTVLQPGQYMQGGQPGQAYLPQQQPPMGNMQGMPQVGQPGQAYPPLQPAPMSNVQAQQLAQTPVFSFIVNKLTDNTPQARVKQVVQFQNVAQGAQNLSFDIRTGESFAILFATTVPGRVRLINTDVNQVVSSSDVYEALPAADNRMPRDWQGGVLMGGAPGMEYLDVEFTPCVSQQYANDPRVVQFQGVLPNCSQESATKKYTPAAANNKGGVIESGAKAMFFPPSAHPGQPVAVAPANYSKGGALTFRITIVHQPAG